MIIIEISGDIRSFHIERWEMVPKLTTGVTKNTQPLVPKALQTFEIHASGTVTPPGSQLTISYLSIFDVPDPNGADIVFTTNDLVTVGRGISMALQ